MASQTTAYLLGASMGYGVGFVRSFFTYTKPDEVSLAGRAPNWEGGNRSLFILADAGIKKWSEASRGSAEFRDLPFLAGLWFDVEDSEVLGSEASISEFFTETGVQISDVMTLRPVSFTVTGSISEVSNNSWDNYTTQVYQPKTLNEIQDVYFRLMSTLGVGNVSWEQRDKMFTTGFGEIRSADPVGNLATKNLRQSLPARSEGSGKDKVSRRQLRAVWYLLALQQERIPVTVSTPWGSMKNMVITGLKASRNNTPTTSQIEVTFTQFRKVKPILLESAQTQAAKPKASSTSINGDAKSVLNPLAQANSYETSLTIVNTEQTTLTNRSTATSTNQ